MEAAYSAGVVLGSLLIPLVLYVIAILVAKKTAALAWVLYGAGTILTVLSLAGESKTIRLVSTYYGSSAADAIRSQHITKLTIFVVLALAALMLIIARSKKSGTVPASPEADASAEALPVADQAGQNAAQDEISGGKEE